MVFEHFNLPLAPVLAATAGLISCPRTVPDTMGTKAPIHVCVTGAAGQIAYSLLFSVAKGDVFGEDQVCPAQYNKGLDHIAQRLTVFLAHDSPSCYIC